MKRKKTCSFGDFCIYLGLFIVEFCLFYIGENGEPFALAVFFAMAYSKLNLFVSAILFCLSSFAGFSFTALPTYFIGAILVPLSFLLKDRLSLKTKLVPFLGVFLTLAFFVLFAPFKPYALPFESQAFKNVYLQKTFLSAVIFLFCACFSVGLNAVLHKLLSCRLTGEEIIFSLLFIVCFGVGVCKTASVTVYTAIAFFTLLTFGYVTKDAGILVCAFTLSLPPSAVSSSWLERYFIYGIVITLFIKAGRLPCVLALILCNLVFGYTDGLFYENSPLLAGYLLSFLVPSVLFLLFPLPLLKSAENKLIFYREKRLSRIAINRNRASVGQQLFEIAGVFREIEATFSSLGTTDAESAAKSFILQNLTDEVCKKCDNYPHCLQYNASSHLATLIDVGTQKSRASLIDFPKELAKICIDQSGILYGLNKMLGDYRKYMLETENANDGRKLLASQAEGVSEILKNMALDQSQPLLSYTKTEKQIDIAFSKAGIICSEVMLTGEEDAPVLSLIVLSDADVKKLSDIASKILSAPMVVSEKLPIGKDRYCCILKKKPLYDAAFGVASMTKAGEKESGDTHSVIKIDERRFMLALSDGMGSGEYAKKISESTISLLESFYRAKMPSKLVLSTVNKLLSFNKEESFACVDIAIVNLDTGEADVVKIGSPFGFILTGQTLKILESSSLPLGILESLHPDYAQYKLSENDVLLFVSDGITSAFPSSSDLYGYLKNVPLTNPKELADNLLQKALGYYDGEAKDDMTVLAVRLFKEHE